MRCMTHLSWELAIKTLIGQLLVHITNHSLAAPLNIISHHIYEQLNGGTGGTKGGEPP